MKIDVVLPSYKRTKELKRCLDSIERAKWKVDAEIITHVYFSNIKDMNDIQKLLSNKLNIQYHILDGEFKHPEFWNNHIKNMTADVLCYLNDDVELNLDCLNEGVKALTSLDMIVGFNQSNSTAPSRCASAFGLIGKDYINRFPNKEVFCPDYYSLYIDEELGKYAEKIGKFRYCTLAKLNHYHPAWTGIKADETHVWNKRNKSIDVEIYNERKKRGLLWGESFELVRNK